MTLTKEDIDKAAFILIAVLLISTAVVADTVVIPSFHRKLFYEEVAHYTELAISEDWCLLVQQPENHTWAFHREYYGDVISKWERVTRTGLRTKIIEHHDWGYEKYSSGVIIIRVVESDMVIFFFHAIPETPNAGVTYWRPQR